MATLKALMTTLSQKGLQEQRGEIIYNFTSGRTSSARELKPKEINELYRAINGHENQEPRAKKQSAVGRKQTADLDKKRKRLLASIFGVFEKMNKKPTMDYVKAIACRAAKVEDFNDIPPERLNSLYNAFINAQKDLTFAKRLVGTMELELTYLN